MSDKVRLVDYVAERVHQLGVEHVYTLTGGGAMFLNDSIKKHPKLMSVCNHHEQASAMAAVAHAKYTNGFSVVIPTTGCGSTNCITGLLDAWQDNLPCVFISGQVNKAQTCFSSTANIRQFGVQEANIVEIVKSITKYAVMIENPEDIAYHLDKAFHLASTARRGPVWVDIPLDVQGALINPSKLERFVPEEKALSPGLTVLENMLQNSSRPIILAGNGVRLSGAAEKIKLLAEQHNIPVVTTFLSADLLPSKHPLNMGRIGIKGNRAANFAVQNSDFLLSIGCRLSVPSTGYNYEYFAREAKIAVVDIDPEEHKKDTIKIDLFVEMDAKDFISKFEPEYCSPKQWTDTCSKWKTTWPVFLPEHKDDEGGVSMYHFMDKLSTVLPPTAAVVGDAGSAYYVPCQALQIKGAQRLITPGAQGEMGFTLPACIGLSFAMEEPYVVGITGDGSFQTNIQELQTIVQYDLPVKIFVWNNDGYLSIRTTQRKYFEDRFVGTDKDSGVSFPETRKIADAYGIKYFRVSSNVELDERLQEIIDFEGPAICEVMCKKWDKVLPTIGAKKLEDGQIVSQPLENMFPFLTEEELRVNMIVRLIEEK